MGKFGGVWFQYQDTYGNDVDPGPVLQAGNFRSGDDEIWWYPLGPGDVNSLTAISLKVMLASDSPTIAMKNVKYLALYADDSRDVLFDDDEILDFTGSLGGKKTPLYFLYDTETAENQSDDEGEGNSSVTTGKRDKGPSQYGVWFKFEDTYGNNVDPGSSFNAGKFKSGDDEIWWYDLSPDEVNSLTAISFKIIFARQGGAMEMKDIKYLDIYADDTKNELLGDDEILNFTGSLGGKKTRPLYLLYDIQTAENPSADEGEDKTEHSGEESSEHSGENSSDDRSDDDRGTGGDSDFVNRVVALTSRAQQSAYIALNRGDILYTDLMINSDTYGDLFFNVEKRNKRGNVIDKGAVRIGDISPVPVGLEI